MNASIRHTAYTLLALLLLSPLIHAQNIPGEPPPLHQPDIGTELRSRTLTSGELSLSWGVLAFGAVLIGLEILVMLKLKKGWGTNNIRITGLTLIITASLFLLTAGYSATQVGPVMGLLGTIAGYLLGKSEGVNRTNESTDA
jgi:hypothetical protein